MKTVSCEECFVCGDYTGRSGSRCEDSLYDMRGDGPYCENCWDQPEQRAERERMEAEEKRQDELAKLRKIVDDALVRIGELLAKEAPCPK